MVQTCAVRGCKANSRRGENLHFYQFPSEKSNLAVRKQWLDNVQRCNPDGSEWDPKYFHKVCGKHFKDGRPTLQNPVPELEMGEEAEEPVLPPPRRGRPPKSAQPTSDSEAKGADSDTPRMESNEESNSSAVSETPKATPSGQATPSTKSPPSDLVPRSSGRKRKKRVLPDALSDEEVLDGLQEEPETYTIWRARSTTSSKKLESQEPAVTVASSRMMRPRRTLSATQPPEAEPEPLPPSKKKRFIMVGDNGDEEEKDAFCWMCHKEGVDLGCELCPRGFHLKCLDINQACPSWVCPECEKVMRAECVDTRSPAMSLLTIDQLCVILRFTCSQMRITGSEPFSQPVDSSTLPLYSDFIANPIDFATLEKNIRRRTYGSTEGFLADVKWMLHNSIVFNGSNNKLTGMARAILRICKQEISDIEGCPDCYTNAWIKQDKNWFMKPCRIPHTLVWAKLKGYPFWPGKAIIEDSGQTDVRFFGAHDRAWVPTTNVFLLSREPPVEMKNRRLGLEEAMDELNLHIKKLRDKFGSFKYAAANVQYDPAATYSQFNRSGELKPEIKKELGVPVKTRGKSDSKDTTGEAVKASTVKGERSSNTDTSDQVVTRLGDCLETKSDTDKSAKGASAAVTPTKSPGAGKQKMIESGSPECTPSKKGHVDLSSVQQADSRGVFEVSSEALGPDVTKIQRKKIPYERILRTSPRVAAQRASIVEHLQQKMKEAEMESSDEKDNSSEEKLKDESAKPSLEIPTKIGSVEDSERLKSPNLIREETNRTDTIPAKDELPMSSAVDLSDQSPPVLEPFGGGEGEKLEFMETLSSGGTPKKNPLLANLVESCKAKLGITSEEELKADAADAETSPSLEMVEENRSSSPQTSASSKADEDEDDDDEDDDNEDDDDDDEVEDDDDEDYEEEEDEEDEVEMEKVSRNTKKKVKTDEKEESMGEDEEIAERDVEMESIKATRNSYTKREERDETQKGAKTGRKSSKCAADHSQPTLEKDPSWKAVQEDGSEEQMEVDEFPSTGPTTTQMDNVKVAMEAQQKNSSNTTVTLCLDNKNDEFKTQSVDGEVAPDEGSAVSSKAANKRKVKDVSQEVGVAKERVEVAKEGMVVAKEGVQVAKGEVHTDINQPFPSGLLEELAKPSLKNDIEASTRLASSPEAMPVRHGSQSMQKPSVGSLAASEAPEELPKEQSITKLVAEKAAAREREAKRAEIDQPVENEPAEETETQAEVNFDVSPEMRMPLTAASRKLKTLKAMLRNDQSDGDGDTEFNVAKYVNKAMDGVQSVFQQMFDDFISSDMGHKTSKHLKTELERTKWHYEQAILEQQHNGALILAEVRMVLEHAQNAQIKKLIKLHEEELDRIVEETKSKQWCANCLREAMFYCCWNTSYCNYPCQQKHWAKHMSHCTQSSGTGGNLTPHDVTDITQTTAAQHVPTGKSTEQISRVEGRGTKRPHSEMSSPRPATVNTPGAIQYLSPQITGPGGGMVQYITAPIGGSTSASPVALQQLLTNQSATTTSTGTPIMYQLVQQPQSQVPANIRIISPQSTPTTGSSTATQP